MKTIGDVANIDAIANVINENSKEVFFFVPWIGKNYNQGLKGSKVLVVGVSHYCKHSNVCIHSNFNNVCSNFHKNVQCKLGCNHFQECTGGKTKDYNDYCAWMKEYCDNYEDLCKAIDEITGDKVEDIFEKLKSTTIGEVCNFLNNIETNKSFKKFTDFCCEYFECKSISDFWKSISFVNYSQNFQPGSTGNKFKESDFKAFNKYIELLKPKVVIVWGCALGSELEKRGFKKEAIFDGYNWVNEGIQFVNSYHPSYGGFKDKGRLEKALNTAFQEASKVTNG